MAIRANVFQPGETLLVRPPTKASFPHICILDRQLVPEPCRQVARKSNETLSTGALGGMERITLSELKKTTVNLGYNEVSF